MDQVHADTALAPGSGQAHGQEAGHGEDHVPHVLPLGKYLKVWGALLVLTGITVGVSYFDFGELNIVVALLVATVKASLVALVFMHLAYDNKFNAVILSASVIFLVVLLGLTLVDTSTRAIADPVEARRPRDYTMPFADGKPDFRDAVLPAKATPEVAPPKQ